MLIKSLMLGAVLALASVATVHANGYSRNYAPSAVFSFGSDGISLRLDYGYSRKEVTAKRFKSRHLYRGISRGYSKDYREHRIRRKLLTRGKYSKGNRILGGSWFGRHRRHR